MKYCLLPATTMKPTAVFPECFHFNLALDSRAAINLRQPQIIDYLELFDAVKVNLRINPTNSDEFPQLESQNPAYQFAQLFHYDLLLESGKHRMEVSAATNFSRYHGTPGASIVRTSLSQSLSSTQLAEVPRVAIKPLIPTPLLCIYSKPKF